jgi:hypothetical protein
MHLQLAAIVEEFESGSVRLHGLVQATSAERWARRPTPDRWSAAECVAHLNLTTLAFKPLVEPALDEARRLKAADPGAHTPGDYSRGLLGGLLWRALGKPGRFRAKTTPAFVPGEVQPLEGLVAEF